MQSERLLYDVIHHATHFSVVLYYTPRQSTLSMQQATYCLAFLIVSAGETISGKRKAVILPE